MVILHRPQNFQLVDFSPRAYYLGRPQNMHGLPSGAGPPVQAFNELIEEVLGTFDTCLHEETLGVFGDMIYDDTGRLNVYDNEVAEEVAATLDNVVIEEVSTIFDNAAILETA